MILIEECPRVSSLKQYVDRYQVFVIEEPAFLKTIPNAKIECYLVKKGGFAEWDTALQSFVMYPRSGILPATNQTSLYRIPATLICLNIKFNLDILAFPLFSNLLTHWKDFDIADVIPEKEQKNVLSRITREDPAIDVEKLDAVIAHALSNQPIDKKLNKLVKLMQDQIANKLKVVDLANSLHMSQKSTERWIRKQFNLTPKKLLQVIRFEHVSRKLKNHPNKKLIDSLEFGYYDQSHFIKECQKITGYAPKDLFYKMKLPTNDIIFEKFANKS
ncbi:MAG: helix-turn-helix transcriptional regulator [Bacteroidota bacterium]